ncbi:hypothetical protein L1887_26865 [Cichorium endivia]|nr:hypothetical protein L1887_26865 [Cichorium endivia]
MEAPTPSPTARFLVSAYNLTFVSPDRFRTLLSLQGSVPSQPDPDSSATFLHSLISSICPPPPLELGFSELTSVLLAKDKLNAFGLMELFSEEREERFVRAYDIYPVAVMDEDGLDVDDTIDEDTSAVMDEDPHKAKI